MRRQQHQVSGLMGAALTFACLLPLAAGEASLPSDTTPPKPASTAEPAGEVKPADPATLRLQPALISVSAKKGGMVSFNDQEPSKLLGGVAFGYEEIRVLCDHVDYWQSKLPGVKRATLDHALITSGPEAEEPAYVVFDSRATKLPQISFRGLMRPREVEVIRQPLTPEDQARLEKRKARELEERKARDKAHAEAKPVGKGDVKPAPKSDASAENKTAVDKAEVKPTTKSDVSGDGKAGDPKAETTPVEPPVLVRFRVLLHQFGDFTGDLKTTDGWSPHFGWAEEAEVMVVCDLLPDGIANPRFDSIDLKGRAAGEGVDKRPARLGRKHIPLVGAAVKKEFDADAYDWWAESSHITIDFDDQGRVLRIKTGADYRGEGTPSLDTPVQTPDPASAPKPVQKPEAAAPAKP